jgi:hypothetical protein
MDSVWLHAALWLLAFATAAFCLRRASHYGRGGFDAYDIPKVNSNYAGVTIWGVLGVAVGASGLIDLTFFFNPPPPSMR